MAMHLLEPATKVYLLSMDGPFYEAGEHNTARGLR